MGGSAPGGADVDRDLAFGGGLPVGDGHGDGLAAGLGACVLEGQESVGAHLDLVPGVAAGGAHHEEVVAVRVDPVGQDVLADQLSGLDHKGRLPVGLLARRGVLPRRHDVEGDVGGRGEPAAVIDGVFEGLRAGFVGRDRDLEARGPVYRCQESGFQWLRGTDGEDVAVGVGVVVQHGEDGRLAGADAEGVRFGRRRFVGLASVRQHGLLDFVRGVLLGVVGCLLRRDDVVPVVHQLHVVVDQPHIARVHVVEDHEVPVHPERIAGRRAGLGDGNILVIGVVGAVPDIPVRPGPRGMHAAGQLHRGRRHALPAELNLLGRRAVQRLEQQRLLRRQRDAVRRGARQLQLRVLRVRDRDFMAARQEQLPAAGIENHRLVSHHRQLQVAGSFEAVPGAHLGVGALPRRAHACGGDLS